MYATRTRTNRSVTATHWNGTSWSNGAPTAIKDAHIDADYSTSARSFSCRDLVITGTSIFTIVADSYVKLLRDIVQDDTSKIHIKNDGDLMILNKNAAVGTAKVKVEKTFPNNQRLDYEFISSPISGIPIKSISPGTLDNRFYTYDEASNSYVSLNPNLTLSSEGSGYHIRTPATFPTIPNDFNISVENLNGQLNKGLITKPVTRLGSGFNLIGNPYLGKINSFLLYLKNGNIFDQKFNIWNKTNGSQGIIYEIQIRDISNLKLKKNILNSFQGLIIQKKFNSSPYNVIFTPEMMLISENFSEPDRLYVNIKQNAINKPIGGFCYDIKKFKLPFNDITGAAAISIIENNSFKIITRKDSFSLSDVISIRVFFEVTATYTITIRDLCGLFSDLQHIYLVDNLLNITHDLKLSDYTFSSNAGEFLSRFVIKFQL